MNAKQERHVLDFSERGIRLLPQYRSGKKPCIENWQNIATTDMVVILQWAKQFPKANFAALCGETTDILLIDIDEKNDEHGLASWKEFEAGRGIETLTVRSPSGGKHLYFRWDKRLDFTKIQGLLPGVEAIGNRQCVTIPGSFYANGAEYLIDIDAPIAPAPEWLVEKIIHHKAKPKPAKAAASGGLIPSGQRNVALASLAGKLQRQGIGATAMLAAIREENKTRCEPPLPLAEVKEIVESISSRYEPHPDPEPPEDNIREFVSPDIAEGITSKILLDNEYAEPAWIVDQLVPPGLMLLAGKPKAGKSWLALQMAAATSVGMPFLNHYETTPGKVLYLALEDSERRARNRFESLHYPGSDNLMFHFDWPRGIPGLKGIQDAVSKDPEIKLIIIDTLGRFLVGIDFNKYDQVNAPMSNIQKLAGDLDIAIVLVAHTRKSGSGDFIETVSGSNAMTGAADTIAVLSRGRGQVAGFIEADGREYTGALDIALKLNQDTGWEYLGPGSEYRLSEDKRKVIEVLREAEEAVTPKDIAAMTGIEYGKAKLLTYRMNAQGLIHKQGYGKYTLNE